MFKASRDVLSERVHHYTFTQDRVPLSYAKVLEFWQADDSFSTFFTTTLSASPFSAFRWETPPISRATAGRQFECVLLDAPELLFPADMHTFAEHFADDAIEEGVVIFDNLGRDATLVVPTPQSEIEVYAHLAAFLRGAPDMQRHALWRALGLAADARLVDSPLWISTHGGGVAWVHIRLDSRPKYYGYAPYRSFRE